jgi:hypothetical protein
MLEPPPPEPGEGGDVELSGLPDADTLVASPTAQQSSGAEQATPLSWTPVGGVDTTDVHSLPCHCSTSVSSAAAPELSTDPTAQQSLGPAQVTATRAGGPVTGHDGALRTLHPVPS